MEKALYKCTTLLYFNKMSDNHLLPISKECCFDTSQQGFDISGGELPKQCEGWAGGRGYKS